MGRNEVTADGGRVDRQVSADTASFACFYDRHYDPVVRALSLVLGDSELAADCAQEAMLKAMRRYGDIADMRNPAGWLFRVGLNIGRSTFRRLRREVLGLFVDRATVDPEPPRPGLVRALRALPVEQRAVVVLRFYLDLTVEQTADALGVAAGTVKSRQHRALARLGELANEEAM